MEKRYTFREIPFDELDNSDDYDSAISSPYFKKQWLEFVKEWRGYTPRIFQILSIDNESLGFFCGFEKRILFWKMLGSPLPGCLAQNMGFSFNKEITNINELTYDLLEYLHSVCKYSYVSIIDEKIGEDIFSNNRIKIAQGESYVSWILDIDKSLEDIKKGFSKTYRNYLNKFVKSGGRISEDYSTDFIAIHNEQLKDVYAKDGLTSPDIVFKYSLLLKKLTSRESVYCIKAEVPGYDNIASSIYVYGEDIAYFLSNASYSDTLSYRPNQSLMWQAIQFLKEKGVKTIDLVGPGEYKSYYGAKKQLVPCIVYSPNPVFHHTMQKAVSVYYRLSKYKKSINSLLTKIKCLLLRN